MGAPLIEFYLPDAGDGRGAPQVVLGKYAPSRVGSQATLVRYPDRSSPGRVWTCLFVELAPAADAVLAGCKKAAPVWPAVAVVAGRQTVWDGMTNVPDARGAKVGKQVVSWVSDAAGVHACVTSSRFDSEPQRMLQPLVDLGLVDGWASQDGQERRWALANLAVIAPDACPPVQAGAEELRAGLAHLAGYGSVAAMMGTGNYDPTPHVGRSGNVEFKRVRQLRPHRRLSEGTLVHQVSPAVGVGGMIDVLRSGLLLSQRRRRVMGVRGVAQDEDADRAAGFAPMVTCDLEADGRLPTVGFVWNDPCRLLRRLDFAVVPTDPITPVMAGVKHTVAVEADPTCRALDRPDATFPQVAVMDSLDLYGPHGPDRVIVRDNREQIQALRIMSDLGVAELGGRSVTQAVEVNPAMVAPLAAT
jgi:hypothetical protein